MNRCVIVKSLIKCCLVVLALAASAPAQAQTLKMSGFAGEDKRVTFAPDQDYITVKLGTDDPNPDCEFFWEVIDEPENADYFLSGQNSSQPEFIFGKIDGQFLIEATRVSYYGYQREYVWVSASSNIHIATIKNIKNCYSTGETVSIADFEITTNPPGYESCIHVHPDDKEIGDLAFGTEEIRFQVRNLDGSVEDDDMTADITVVPEWASASTGDTLLDLSNPVKDFKERYIESYVNSVKEKKEAFNKLRSYVRIIRGCDKKLEGLKTLQKALNRMTPPGAPFKTKDTIEIDFSNLGLNMECCEDDAALFVSWNGGINFYAGFEMNVQLWPPIPKLGLSLVGGAGAGVKASVEAKVSFPKYQSCYSLHLPFEIYGDCSLGLRLSAFDPDLLSFTGMVTVEVHGESDFTIIPQVDMVFNGLYATMGVNVSATFIGFNKEIYSHEWPKFYFIDGEEEE